MMLSYNTQIVLACISLLGATASLVGTFAVLRRRALTGDALAHASLPGVCLGYLFIGERSLPVLLLGALGTGLLGIVVIAALRRWTRIKEDAGIGIVLSVFFGAGVVLLQQIQKRADGGTANLASFIFGSTAGLNRLDLEWIAYLAVATLLCVLLLYKELKLLSFDPAFAQAQGWPVFLLDLVLMGLIAVTVVIGLPAVGVLMISALLIVPAATARFWTQNLSTHLVLAACFGVTASVTGALLSSQVDNLPAGATIILTATALLLLSTVLGPLWRRRAACPPPS